MSPLEKVFEGWETWQMEPEQFTSTSTPLPRPRAWYRTTTAT
ncbi:MAG: hypothetical protein ACRDMH_12480 [Solirubrobacterales bacterium]